MSRPRDTGFVFLDPRRGSMPRVMAAPMLAVSGHAAARSFYVAAGSRPLYKGRRVRRHRGTREGGLKRRTALELLLMVACFALAALILFAGMRAG